MLITCLKVKSDLLISMLYFANFPYVPVNPILSEPAKSTNSILLDKICVGSEWWKLSNLILRTEWLREEEILSLCDEFILFLSP